MKPNLCICSRVASQRPPPSPSSNTTSFSTTTSSVALLLPSLLLRSTSTSIITTTSTCTCTSTTTAANITYYFHPPQPHQSRRGGGVTIGWGGVGPPNAVPLAFEVPHSRLTLFTVLLSRKDVASSTPWALEVSYKWSGEQSASSYIKIHI